MSASISQLEAVNDMLRAIGQPAVTTVPSSDDGSDEWSAAQILERRSKKIQGRGWFYNRTIDREFNFASVSLTGTIATGTFTKGELVTQATSGAQGYIVDAYTTTDTTYLICPLPDSETFTGTANITGASSAVSTATVTAVSNPTSGYIVLPAATISYVLSDWSSWRNIGIRNGYLYDNDDNTATFDESVRADIIEQIDYDQLPQKQAEYIVADAIIEFQHTLRRRSTDEAQRRLSNARSEALREQNDVDPVNLLTTPHARRVKGNRNDSIFKSGLGNG